MAYRIGKDLQERQGTWPYGVETPEQTLCEISRISGLKVIREYTVGARHSLVFLEGFPLHTPLKDWMAEHSEEELNAMRQGYLLVSVSAVDTGDLDDSHRKV